MNSKLGLEIKDSGIYNLIIKLSEEKKIKIGRLGTFVFPVGFYIYTGSAQNGLEKRINRHYSSQKKFHWHIDYLLYHAKIVKAIRHLGDKKAECELSSLISKRKGAQIIAERFGSSDCICNTHLYYFKKSPNLRNLFTEFVYEKIQKTT